MALAADAGDIEIGLGDGQSTTRGEMDEEADNGSATRADPIRQHLYILGAAVVGLFLAGYLPWYDDGRFSSVTVNGYANPLSPILPMALLLGLALVADGIATMFGEPLIRAIGGFSRSRVRTGIGLLVFGCIAYKYLFRTDGRSTGLFIALALAALTAYEAYAIGVAEGEAAAAMIAGTDDNIDDVQPAEEEDGTAGSGPSPAHE